MKQSIAVVLFFTILAMVTGSSVYAGKSETVAADLKIHITGFANSEGVAKVAVVNSKENYDSDGTPYLGFNFKIINNEVRQTIRVPQGEYAVKVFHDENTNDEMDRLMFGIPSEKYGFSKNARGIFGPPAFEDARILVNTAEHKIEIKVQ
ncbi:MAG TPA: hypothetical protein DHV36_03880 [Desulfobacteraceae bacterium]|nr:hypothetical protein [Desulfobacteraceae bacterium]|tara:strand:- start:1346 stop:1795 length:450 start_codon:yes stop_codon:yes gene_type:complete